MKNPSIIIWSKDRACQLDLLLFSLSEYWHESERPVVLWTASNGEYRRGYNLLARRWLGFISMMEQTDFRRDVLGLLEFIGDYVLGISDDCVFIRHVDLSKVNMSSDVAGFSLRLGRRMTYCQPAGLSMKEPNYIHRAKYLKWCWLEGDQRVCYYYPHPCDSTIFEKTPLLGLLQKGQFSNPYQMEIFMNNNRPTSRPFLMSFTKSHLVSIAANECEQGASNENAGQSLEWLNQQWLTGHTIDLDPFRELEPKQCHLKMRYIMRRA